MVGKVRRLRQKYHLSLKREKEEKEKEAAKESVIKAAIPQVSVPISTDDIFAGINISWQDLQQTLGPGPSAEATSLSPTAKVAQIPLGWRSEESVSSRLKNQYGNKKEKRKARHDLLLQRIDTLEALKKEAKQKQKRRALPLTSTDKVCLPGQRLSPALKPNFSAEIRGQRQKNEKKTVTKAVLSQKQRRKKDLADMKKFRSILSNPNFKANPLAAISNYIQNTARQEAMK